jgi:hypothetical protein
MAAVIPTVQTWDCLLEYGEEFLQITSLPDKKKVRRIDATELPGAWSFFNVVENQLIDDLQFYKSGSVVKLNRRQLEAFAKMCDRAEKARQEWEKEQETAAQKVGEEIDNNVKDSIPNGVPESPKQAPVLPTGAAKEVAGNTVQVTESRHSSRTRGHGVDEVEIRVDALQRAVKGTESGFYMVIYDIPVKMNKQCPNPSHIFWRYGFRLNDSCWVFTGKGLNTNCVQSELRLWQQHKIATFIIRYHDDEVAQIRAIAQIKLEEEIRRVHTSLITTIDRADQQLKDALVEVSCVTPEARDEAQKKRDLAVRARINTATEALDAAISCAEHFDTSESVSELLRGLRMAVRSRAITFNHSAREKHIKRVTVP